MRFADLGIDELLDMVNNPETEPELRERAARFLRRMMETEE